MNPPVLVTPPPGPGGIVTTSELRTVLKIDTIEEDAYLESLRAQAVARLDGWSGLLGRCILPQSWSQDFPVWGTLRLAFPDVSEATVRGFDADGAEVAPDTSALEHDVNGSYVVAAGPPVVRVRVTFTASMPAGLLPSVREAVELRVAMRYLDREGLQDVRSYERQEEGVIARLRWTDRP